MDTHSKMTWDGVGMVRKNTKCHRNVGIRTVHSKFNDFSKIDLGSKLTLENVHIEELGIIRSMPRTQEVITKNSTITGRGSGKDFPPIWLRMSSQVWNCKLSCLELSLSWQYFNSIQFRSYPLNAFDSMIRLTRLHFQGTCVCEESFLEAGETTFLNRMLTISFGFWWWCADGWAYDLS